MEARERLNDNVLKNNPVVLGRTEKAPSEWCAGVGLAVSELRRYAWGAISKSTFWKEMNEYDREVVMKKPQAEDDHAWLDSHNLKPLNERYFDIHYPNGIMRLFFEYDKDILFFEDHEYGVLVEKPTDPGPCTSGCEGGCFYKWGTSYPCGQCLEISDYKLKLKVWSEQNGG